MKCEEAAQLVSALCEGDRIPPDAARHIGSCNECLRRLQEYCFLGAELRRLASLNSTEESPKVSWNAEPRRRESWWHKGTRTMRIPRAAFALMLAAITTLSAGIMFVRAKEKNKWLYFEVHARSGPHMVSGTIPAAPDGISDRHIGPFSRKEGDGTIAIEINFRDLNAGMEKLGIRTLWIPGRVGGEKANEQAHAQPERELWFTPGEMLSIPVEGYGAIEVTGEFLEKLPEDLRTGMYPREESFRIVPPVFCLSGDRVLSSVDDGGGEFSRAEHYFAYHSPGEGWFLIAGNPFEGAVRGTVRWNQIKFSLEGRTYLLLTGAPILYGESFVWVMHHPQFQFTQEFPSYYFAQAREAEPDMTFGDVKHLTETLLQLKGMGASSPRATMPRVATH
jgi:hypothetical protein